MPHTPTAKLVAVAEALPQARVFAFLGGRPGEGPLAAWMVLLFAFTQASQGLGANAADTLFFLRFGVESLPLMILLSGPVVMVASLLYTGGRPGGGPWLAVMGCVRVRRAADHRKAADLGGSPWHLPGGVARWAGGHPRDLHPDVERGRGGLHHSAGQTSIP